MPVFMQAFSKDDNTVAEMWEQLSSAQYHFGLDTRKNPIASRWSRFLRSAGKEVKDVCTHACVYPYMCSLVHVC